jgi:spore coat polysaccharide biosynthesis protein SpsF
LRLGRVGVVVAARTLSSRLPGKALLPLQGVPMVLFLLRRLSALRQGLLVFATTDLPSDDELADIVASEGFEVFRGSGPDLVARYAGAAKRYDLDTVVRVTGDCPFLSAEIVDRCIQQAADLSRFDLATTKGAFPVGLDVEIFGATALADLDRHSLSVAEREHLTLYFYEHADEFCVRTIVPPAEWQPVLRHFTVDTPADYEDAKAMVSRFDDVDFSVDALLATVAA